MCGARCLPDGSGFAHYGLATLPQCHHHQRLAAGLPVGSGLSGDWLLRVGLSAYGLMFLGAHFVWAFSLMFLFSGRGYWQELIESIVWAHNKLKVAPAIHPASGG
jgi:hypothetical protein